jgi:hypothetical protein
MTSATKNPSLQAIILWLIVPATVFLLARYILFVPVRVEVRADRAELWTNDTVAARVSVAMVNRAGGRVPFRRHRLSCYAEEGVTLVGISYEDDSTTAVLRQKGEPGVVVLRVVSEASPFPLYFRLKIVSPLAAEWRTHAPRATVFRDRSFHPGRNIRHRSG